MSDCHGECGELCKPLDDDLAGTDGDRLMDIAERGECLDFGVCVGVGCFGLGVCIGRVFRFRCVCGWY